MTDPHTLTLVGGQVALPEGVRDDVTVVVSDGRIVAVQDRTADQSDDDGQVIDVAGRLVTPGLIDLHIHGGYGWSFESPDDAGTILAGLAAAGVTSAQASLASDRVPALIDRVRMLDRHRLEPEEQAATLLGVHLEGPFLAEAQSGAHDPALLRAPSTEDIDAVLQVADAVSMITVAPELPGAVAAVRRMAAAGIVVAAGHSEAEGADLAQAVDAGLSHITHLWSGQSSTVRRGPWRIPGLLEESLASTGLTAEIIADGAHLPPPLLEIARRCLGDRLIVVSDGTAGVGMPTGFRYDLATVQCEVRDGVGMVLGADAFGGSTTALPQMLDHLHGQLGWPLHEAIALATCRPAGIAGIADHKGSIRVGQDADLAIFDPGFRPWGTVLRGRWVPSIETSAATEGDHS